MLLYQQFKKVLEELGDLRLAWFTSFNMDIYFVEKYLLSAINQMPPEDFRSLRDYEVLNECLHQRDEGDKKIDIRFFYDYRANNSTDSKKTCVSTVPVSPKNLGSEDGKVFNGVFHPKIALFVNHSNQAYVLATSANLSLSAWARNSECAIFKKIEDRTNARKVIQFFKTITKADDQQILDELSKEWEGLSNESADWDFLSSFERGGLLDRLDINEELYAWSPYLSDDLPEIFNNYLKGCNVKLIPDAIEGKKVRIAPVVLDKIKSLDGVDLMKDNFDFKEEVKPFVHAKTWLTKGSIALGSWNFTNAGLNLTPNNCNIEAGIIQRMDASAYAKLIKSVHITSFESPIGTEITELQLERRNLLDDYSLSCRVIADWDTFKYTILDIPDSINIDEYTIKLPGLSSIELKQLNSGGISFIAQHTSLLKDRVFTVYKGKKVAFCGLITELNTEKRPAFGYENLNDLLNAWLNEKAGSDNGRQVHRGSDENESGDELNEQLLSQMSSDYSQGWFTMFVAMENMKQKFISLKGDQRALKLHAYQMPGCLSQLHEHAFKLSKTEKELTVSKPFLWFVINEVNVILKVFNNLNDDEDLSFQPIKNIPLHELSKEDAEKAKKWLNQIRKDCYAESI